MLALRTPARIAKHQCCRVLGRVVALFVLFGVTVDASADTMRGALTQSLPEQSAAQCAARLGPRHRRDRAAGAVRLSAAISLSASAGDSI